MPKTFGQEPNEAFVFDDGTIGAGSQFFGNIEQSQAAAYDIERQGQPLKAKNIRAAIHYVKNNPDKFLCEETDYDLKVPEFDPDESSDELTLISPDDYQTYNPWLPDDYDLNDLLRLMVKKMTEGGN